LARPGCPKTTPQGPNDISAADYKGQLRLTHGHYCFPLTVSDLASRYVLGVDAHPAISLDRTIEHFRRLFHAYGLPNRIRTDNGSPFASSALARLSHLSAWFIKLDIYPELIEPGQPQQPALAAGQGMGSTRGCTARSSRKPPSLPPLLPGLSSISSTAFARSSTSSALMNPLG
jgi:hypothetical protein